MYISFFKNSKNNTARPVFHLQALYTHSPFPIDHLIIEQDFPWVRYWGQSSFPLGVKEAHFGKCLPSALWVELEQRN